MKDLSIGVYVVLGILLVLVVGILTDIFNLLEVRKQRRQLQEYIRRTYGENDAIDR